MICDVGACIPPAARMPALSACFSRPEGQQYHCPTTVCVAAASTVKNRSTSAASGSCLSSRVSSSLMGTQRLACPSPFPC